MVDIKRPNIEIIEEYKKKWETIKEKDDYDRVLHDKALEKLIISYPNNNDEAEVFIKAFCLNNFYSTSIFDIKRVMKKIMKINFDERLENQDVTLVDDIARIIVEASKNNPKDREFYFYSFATKYCCLHEYFLNKLRKGKKSDFYPIYDKFVVRCLVYFRDKDKFCTFTKVGLKNYSELKRVLDEFRSHYGLETITYRDLDKYLYLLGKEYFND